MNCTKIVMQVSTLYLYCLGASAEVDLVDISNAAHPNEFFITFETVTVPVGRIVLFRSSREICALRVSSYKSTNDRRRDEGFADYQFQRFPLTERVLSEAVELEVGRFESRGYNWFGHLAWERGNRFVTCGDNRIKWIYPTAFGLYNQIPELAIAPTAWTSFSAVNVQDPALRWFREDKSQTRPPVTLPIETLPGFAKKAGDKRSPH